MSFSSLITNAFNIWAISWKWNKYRTWQCSSETINIIFFNGLSMFDEKKCHKIVNSIELDNNIRIFKSDKCNVHCKYKNPFWKQYKVLGNYFKTKRKFISISDVHVTSVLSRLLHLSKNVCCIKKDDTFRETALI
jgi:hypothetical protein